MFFFFQAEDGIRDLTVTGVQTCALPICSAEAMEVAARENATAQGGIHELQDLVMKIARTEKIDESKELAEDIQDSLSKRIQKSNKPMKNRGVRKEIGRASCRGRV